jgi:alpha-N-acetylglucosamine transferase
MNVVLGIKSEEINYLFTVFCVYDGAKFKKIYFIDNDKLIDNRINKKQVKILS